MADPVAARSAGKPKMVQAAVAPRHTVMVGKRPCGPGTLVEFPEDEAAHLRAAGFLLDPNVPEAAAGQGPVYGADGDMIRAG